VTVVSVVTFQIWFNTYSGGLFGDIEGQSGDGLFTTDFKKFVNGILYFENGYNNLSIREIKVDGVLCEGINGSYGLGLVEFDLRGCTGNASSSTFEIAVYTDKGVISEYVVYSGNSISLGSLSSSLICDTDNDGDGFINFSCASYPMTVLTLEGHLDPDDFNATVEPDVSCVWNNNKSNCLSNYVIDGCGTDTVLDTGIGLCWDRNFNRHGTSDW
jgi:hypothetical protein